MLQIAAFYGNELSGGFPATWDLPNTFPVMTTTTNGMCVSCSSPHCRVPALQPDQGQKRLPVAACCSSKGIPAGCCIFAANLDLWCPLVTLFSLMRNMFKLPYL